MDFSISEKQSISFLFSFDKSIYTTPGKEALVNKYDTFWFKITNLTSWKSKIIPSYFWAFPWTRHTINLSSDFFWDKNWKYQIKIEAISNNIYVYSDYYKKGNITEFYIDVKWIWVWASKKVGIWETENNCKTTLLDNTYTLEPCWWLNIELIKWTGDKKFNFRIKASKLIDSDIYINRYWNKEKRDNNITWFPKESLKSNKPSWEKHDDYIEFEYIVKNNNLQVWSYSWTFYIWIKKWDTSIKNWLNLPIKVNVRENINESKIDYCKTQVWESTLYLSPCQLEITHTKWTWNQEFNFEVKSSDWKSYSYSILWNLEKINGWLDYTWMPKFSVQWWASNWFTPNKESKYFVDELLDVWTYNTFVYIVPNIWGYSWTEYRELKLPIKLIVKESWENQVKSIWTDNNNLLKDFNKIHNYCTAEINWITYKLEPCNLDSSMKDWSWNKEFNFTINSSDVKKVYSYDIYWTVEWFPIYWILNMAGWWAVWNRQINLKFNDSVLDKWNYNWYLKINITQDGVQKELRFLINIIVN